MSSRSLLEKGKSVERRGRKATGPFRADSRVTEGRNGGSVFLFYHRWAQISRFGFAHYKGQTQMSTGTENINGESRVYVGGSLTLGVSVSGGAELCRSQSPQRWLREASQMAEAFPFQGSSFSLSTANHSPTLKKMNMAIPTMMKKIIRLVPVNLKRYSPPNVAAENTRMRFFIRELMKRFLALLMSFSRISFSLSRWDLKINPMGENDG